MAKESPMGGKPSTSTPADKRLKRNRVSPAVRAARLAKAKPAKPKFGSPAWDAEYHIKPFHKGQ
jgi:hypothetical protein